jgi:hypothetical protein
MPIEIPEVTVRPTINDPASPGTNPATTSCMSAEEKEALIKEVVARVLLVLGSAKERSTMLPDSFR